MPQSTSIRQAAPLDCGRHQNEGLREKCSLFPKHPELSPFIVPCLIPHRRGFILLYARNEYFPFPASIPNWRNIKSRGPMHAGSQARLQALLQHSLSKSGGLKPRGLIEVHAHETHCFSFLHPSLRLFPTPPPVPRESVKPPEHFFIYQSIEASLDHFRHSQTKKVGSSSSQDSVPSALGLGEPCKFPLMHGAKTHAAANKLQPSVIQGGKSTKSPLSAPTPSYMAAGQETLVNPRMN